MRSGEEEGGEGENWEVLARITSYRKRTVFSSPVLASDR